MFRLQKKLNLRLIEYKIKGFEVKRREKVCEYFFM